MKKIILFTCALIALASCKKDKDIDGSDQKEEGIEVKFDSNIITSEVQSTSSRAPLTGNIPTGESVGIFGLDAIVASPADFKLDTYNYEMENMEYKVSNASGYLDNVEGTRIIYPNDGTHNGMAFYSYYPYTSTVDAHSIPVRYDIKKNIDYLYTGQIVKATSITPVTLPFKHAMSRIIVKIKNNTSTTISNVKNTISFGNFPYEGEMDIEDGSILITKHNKTRDIINKTTNIAPNATITMSDLIVFPGSVINSLSCIINENSTEQIKSGLNITMERGKFVTITLIYEPKEPSFISRVDDWVNQQDIDFTIKEE